ncbi:MAG: bacillithiol biosynthesis cysteine-adding enzyme BshC, partial [bacterium]|nr:bacillithiol biosynthesis cysteine-adding enzyme BshC [bacterium]
MAAGKDVRDLYARVPRDLNTCRIAAEETLRHARPWKNLAELLERNGALYGVPLSARSKLSAVRDGKAVMVVTGQQAGYLGGPFYTFLKAYHTTRLAAELERELQMPVLPLFWLEGEDHDLEEVRSANFPDKNGELQTLRFEPGREIKGFEVGRYDVNADEHARQLAEALGDVNEAGAALLREAYARTTLSEAMGKLLARTLGERGLLVVEGMEPDLKHMAAPLWEQVIARGKHLSEILARRSEKLEAEGWSAILKPTPDSYLFYLTGQDHARAALFYDGDLRQPSGETTRMTKHELSRIAREAAERISPKAALRPLYQDFVLPTVAYIAGPGELDYHAQIAPFYAELGVAPPVLFPRLSVTLVDFRAARAAEKSGFSVERLVTEERHTLERETVRDQSGGRTDEWFARARREIEEIYARIRKEIAEIDPTLAGAAQSSAGKALLPLEQLREKTERALKQ